VLGSSDEDRGERAVSVRDRVRGFISENFFVEGFADDASFLRESILDSLGMLELVGFLEREYQFHVSETELVPENLDSLDRVAAFVERKRQNAA
jgi:acyl carrier protein